MQRQEARQRAACQRQLAAHRVPGRHHRRRDAVQYAFVRVAVPVGRRRVPAFTFLGGDVLYRIVHMRLCILQRGCRRSVPSGCAADGLDRVADGRQQYLQRAAGRQYRALAELCVRDAAVRVVQHSGGFVLRHFQLCGLILFQPHIFQPLALHLSVYDAEVIGQVLDVGRIVCLALPGAALRQAHVVEFAASHSSSTILLAIIFPFNPPLNVNSFLSTRAGAANGANWLSSQIRSPGSSSGLPRYSNS